jgi:hypothetical protein
LLRQDGWSTNDAGDAYRLISRIHVWIHYGPFYGADFTLYSKNIIDMKFPTIEACLERAKVLEVELKLKG